jgi:site-specific DNA-methyltransferase (adenine-specific)
LAPTSVDFVLTDPSYLVRYVSRDEKRVRNDDNSAWLHPAFAQIFRVLKSGSYCVASMAGTALTVLSPHGTRQVSASSVTWCSASRYASEGSVIPPHQPIVDVIDWKYTGNRLHPTQKPVSSLRPLIDAFCPAGGLVLDPFCGSGSTLVAAQDLDRTYLDIEIDSAHHETAQTRLANFVIRGA